MKSLIFRAASYLGPEGHGNDLTGLRPWPPPYAADFARGNLRRLHWSLLLPSAPARLARMNLMCRLSLIAAELLQVDLLQWPAAARQRIGVCLETYFGALATDVEFLQNPRPTLFTYSLPSSAIGEICIHYHIKGPALSLISPTPSAQDILAEAADLMDQDNLEACLCLACEAVDSGLAKTFPWPYIESPAQWHACALLLGRKDSDPRERPFTNVPLREACLDWITHAS